MAPMMPAAIAEITSASVSGTFSATVRYDDRYAPIPMKAPLPSESWPVARMI
jgi:hypothetical protein